MISFRKQTWDEWLIWIVLLLVTCQIQPKLVEGEEEVRPTVFMLLKNVIAIE